MGTRLPLVDLPGGGHQETTGKRKLTARKSSAIEVNGPPTKKPAELTVSTNPPKSVSPPLISPFTQKGSRMSLCGFMLFVRKERKTISEKYPHADEKELTNIYQQHWSELTEAVQDVFNSQARQLNLRLGNVSPNSPPEAVRENEADMSKIIQVAHAAPQVKPAPTPVASALSRDTIDRLQTVASTLGLKRRMSTTVERGVLAPPTASAARTQRPAATAGGQQQQAAAAAAPSAMSSAAALEHYYLSLCQPAFPEAGELPLTPAPPQYYLDQWQMMEWQRREAAAARL